MKICLTTYFDNNFEQMGRLCLKSVEEYANKYHFDVKLFNDLKSSRPAPWNKIIIITKLLNPPYDYDFVFWIDSDAIFVRFDKNIMREIKKDKDIYLVKHGDIPNTGMMLIKNTNFSKSLFKAVWNKEEFIYHKWWENAALNDLLGYKVKKQSTLKTIVLAFLYKTRLKNMATKILKKSKLKQALSKTLDTGRQITKVPSKWEEKISWLDLKWNNIPGRFETKKPVINHYPGLDYNERLSKMLGDSKKWH